MKKNKPLPVQLTASIQELARDAAIKYIEDCRSIGILNNENLPRDIGEFIRLTNFFLQKLMQEIQDNI